MITPERLAAATAALHEASRGYFPDRWAPPLFYWARKVLEADEAVRTDRPRERVPASVPAPVTPQMADETRDMEAKRREAWQAVGAAADGALRYGPQEARAAAWRAVAALAALHTGDGT